MRFRRCLPWRLHARLPPRPPEISGSAAMDRISESHRSWNMSRIRGRDTGPEKTVRSVLHRLGLRFRLQRKDLPGRPDIVLPRYRTVVLVHGCFWHRHTGCRFSYTPKSNQHFWAEKFAGTVRRDKLNAGRLRRAGWKVIVIWECQVRDVERLRKRLARLFDLKI